MPCGFSLTLLLVCPDWRASCLCTGRSTLSFSSIQRILMYLTLRASGGKGKRREGPEESENADAARTVINEDAEVSDADEEGDWNLDEGAEVHLASAKGATF